MKISRFPEYLYHSISEK